MGNTGIANELIKLRTCGQWKENRANGAISSLTTQQELQHTAMLTKDTLKHRDQRTDIFVPNHEDF